MQWLLFMRATPKVIPPISLCWPTVLEADVDGNHSQGWTFPPIFCSFCCCVIDGSRGAVWQNNVWHGSVYVAKVCLHSSIWKKWHPLAFIDAFWTFLEAKEWMWAQWRHKRWQAMFQTAMHSCHAGKLRVLQSLLCSWEFTLSNSVIVLFVSVVVAWKQVGGMTFSETSKERGVFTEWATVEVWPYCSKSSFERSRNRYVDQMMGQIFSKEIQILLVEPRLCSFDVEQFHQCERFKFLHKLLSFFFLTFNLFK